MTPTLAAPERPEPLRSGVDLARPVETSGEPRYDAHSLLGRGGMGEVWLYRDRIVGREVAVKKLRDPEHASSSAERRFLREARVQAQLEHPAIVPVYDLGVDEEGKLYFSMRRIRGRTLESVLEGLALGDPLVTQHFSKRKLLGILSSVCLAVHFAHSRGVLHRDLKPTNVMLGDFGEVYVLDWGLARVSGQPEADSELEGSRVPLSGDSAPPLEPGLSGGGDALTAAGALMGTPGYLSPEVLHGGGGAATARSDVFALGAMLFELLTGRRLFPGDPRTALRAMLLGPVPRAVDLSMDVPPELDALCARATALDPEQRLASAGELAEAIERYLDGDRSLAQRRETAAHLTEEARHALERASGEEARPADARKERAHAMQCALQAVALDGESEEARRAVVEALSAPPGELPPEAQAAMDRSVTAARLEGARNAWWNYALWLAGIPAMFVLGVRWPWVIGACTVLNLASMALVFWMSRRHQVGVAVSALLGLTTFGTVAGFTSWLGPFVFVPTVAAVTTLVMTMHATRRERPWYVALGTASVLLPFLLEVSGVLPRYFAFREGNLVLMPRAVGLDPSLTLVGLGVSGVAYTLLPAVFVGRLRDALSSVEKQLFAQAWHVEQLIARGGASSARSPT